MKGPLEDNYNMFGLVSWCCFFFFKASAMRAPKIRRQQQRKPKMRRETLLIRWCSFGYEWVPMVGPP